MPQHEFLRQYRPNVGILLFNNQAQIWLGHRAMDESRQRRDVHRWQMPQGGIDEGEHVSAAAFRELREETGVSSAELIFITPGWLIYDFPPEHKRKNWTGQRQKWAVMLFRGSEEEISLDADDHQEFDKWRWAELEEAPQLIVPFKRDVYEDVVRSLTPLRNFLRKRT